jgi:hypothetical protein
MTPPKIKIVYNGIQPGYEWVNRACGKSAHNHKREHICPVPIIRCWSQDEKLATYQVAIPTRVLGLR